MLDGILADNGRSRNAPLLLRRNHHFLKGENIRLKAVDTPLFRRRLEGFIAQACNGERRIFVGFQRKNTQGVCYGPVFPLRDGGTGNGLSRLRIPDGSGKSLLGLCCCAESQKAEENRKNMNYLNRHESDSKGSGHAYARQSLFLGIYRRGFTHPSLEDVKRMPGKDHSRG